MDVIDTDVFLIEFAYHSFVTWNVKYFKNKTTLAVYTPQEYFAR